MMIDQVLLEVVVGDLDAGREFRAEWRKGE